MRALEPSWYCGDRNLSLLHVRSKPLNSDRRIVVLTGAGVSAGSGLRTYRGPDGVWEKFEVEQYGHRDALIREPLRVWQLFGGLRKALAEAKPNAAHQALAEFESALNPGAEFFLVTQNVDGLHQLAGSRRMVEMHGTIRRSRCSRDSCDWEPFFDESVPTHTLPLCPRCQAFLRPDIVLFGEPIPVHAEHYTRRALRDCDLFIAIGTSGNVIPTANFVRNAAYAGAHTIFVNLEPLVPPNSAYQEVHLGRAEEILPGLLNS